MEYKEETWELETDSEEEDADSDEDPEARRKKLIRPRKIHNKHNEMMRRRLAWRRLKPIKMKQNFVTAATSTNVVKAPPVCVSVIQRLLLVLSIRRRAQHTKASKRNQSI